MNIDKLTYFSYLSIKYNILFPLKKFMSYQEVKAAANKMTFKNKFFPLPFFLSANASDIKDIRNNKIDLFFEKKFIGSVDIASISSFNKNEIANILFKKNSKSLKHPYLDYLKSSGDFLIETRDFTVNTIKNKIKKNYIGFATRNIPHKGHEKIIKYFAKQQKILVHVFEDSSKNKRINSQKTVKAYKQFIRKNSLINKVDLKKIRLPSFLLGPRQAAIHAIIGRNLKCTKFIIGRDHSGYKNFYKTFDSFNFCKKNEKKIKIKIIASGSPIFCKICKKIVFRKDCNCNYFIDISASLIRKTKNKNLKNILTNF